MTELVISYMIFCFYVGGAFATLRLMRMDGSSFIDRLFGAVTWPALPAIALVEHCYNLPAEPEAAELPEEEDY